MSEEGKQAADEARFDIREFQASLQAAAARSGARVELKKGDEAGNLRDPWVFGWRTGAGPRA